MRVRLEGCSSRPGGPLAVDASLDVVLPVLNEEHDLALAVETLLAFLADNL